MPLGEESRRVGDEEVRKARDDTLSLLEDKPEYEEILQRLINWRKNRDKDFPRGWESKMAPAQGGRLNYLHARGILEKTYSSSTKTRYKFINIQGVEEALDSYKEMKGLEIKPPSPAEVKVELPSPAEARVDLSVFDKVVEVRPQDKKVKKVIQKAVNNPGIHVALIGPPSSGKSCRGDTKIITKHSKGVELLKISEIHKKFQSGENLKVLSVNPETLKSEWKEVLETTKHKPEQELLEVTVRGSKKVVVTKDHSLVVTNNKTLSPIKASKLQKGEPLPLLLNANIPESYDQHNGIDLTPELGFSIGAWLSEGTIFFYRGKYYTEICNQDSNFLERFIKGLKNLPPYSLYPEAKKLKQEKGWGATKISKKLGISKSMVEGWIYYESKPQPTFKKKTASRQSYRNGRKEIYNFFRQFVTDKYEKESGKGRTANNKIIPSWVFSTPKDFKKELLKGYLTGDATKKTLSFSSGSKNLRNGIQLLLLSFGIPTTQRKSRRTSKTHYRASIPTAFHNKFKEKIGLLNNVPITNSSQDYFNRIQVDFPRVRKGTIAKENAKMALQQISKFLQSDLVWNPITKIQTIDGEEDHVYDITVKENQNFVTKDGIILHNSLIASCIEESTRSSWISGTDMTKASIRDELVKQDPDLLS